MSQHELSFESTETMTQAEFADWVARHDDGLHHFELLNGRVVMNPPAGYPHGRTGSNLQFLINTHVRKHNLGLVFDSSQGFDLPSGDTVEPDHSFVSWEHWKAAPPPEAGSFLRVVPDLVAEVLSPGS